MQELLGATEIAELLGVTRQRVHQLSKEPDFPAPLARLTLGAVWRTTDIENWRERHRPRPAEHSPAD